MAEQAFFPFSPQYSTWENWNGNLIMFYSEELIPYSEEEEWKVTARNVAQLPTFLAYPVPDPELFDNWEDWASQFSLIVNGPSN